MALQDDARQACLTEVWRDELPLRSAATQWKQKSHAAESDGRSPRRVHEELRKSDRMFVHMKRSPFSTSFCRDMGLYLPYQGAKISDGVSQHEPLVAYIVFRHHLYS